jgi:uncharacterized membrane protein YadS
LLHLQAAEDSEGGKRIADLEKELAVAASVKVSEHSLLRVGISLFGVRLKRSVPATRAVPSQKRNALLLLLLLLLSLLLLLMTMMTTTLTMMSASVTTMANQFVGRSRSCLQTCARSRRR